MSELNLVDDDSEIAEATCSGAELGMGVIDK